MLVISCKKLQNLITYIFYQRPKKWSFLKEKKYQTLPPLFKDNEQLYKICSTLDEIKKHKPYSPRVLVIPFLENLVVL